VAHQMHELIEPALAIVHRLAGVVACIENQIRQYWW